MNKDESESRLYELMRQVAAGQAQSNSKIESILVMLEKHDTAIYGNGSDGLRQRVTSIEQRSKDAERSSARKLKVIIGSFALLNLGASLVIYFLG